MQRPAKPSTPVRFRLPPPVSNSSTDPSPSLENPLRPYGGGWQAKLNFSVDIRPFGSGTRSTLSNSEHIGPLRLQKPLWPEGPHPVHLLLLHPPGGLAGGDQLQLRAKIEPGAQCLVTTPGAGKFYMADVPSEFHVRLDVEEAGLEWLPQETILQDGAQARSTFEFNLSQHARVIASEILVLGRRDFGESFSRGEFKQRISIRRDGKLIFNDSNLWRPAFLDHSVSMAKHHVSALFWAARHEAWHEDEVASLELLLDSVIQAKQIKNTLEKSLESGIEKTPENTPANHLFCGVSQVVPGLLLIRAIGSSVEAIRYLTHQAWAHLRPQIFERQASLPRIWNT